jgi:hypothetical protein
MQCFNGIQWRNFDQKHKDFATGVRNIRFGLSIGGMNHFGEIGNSHSTRYVTFCIYNLTSWLYIKRKFMINLQRKMDRILLSGEARLFDCYFYYSAIAKQPTLKYKLK